MRATTPAFNYDHEKNLSLSPLKLLKTSRQSLSTPKGFGKAEMRFPPEDLFPNPGVRYSLKNLYLIRFELR